MLPQNTLTTNKLESLTLTDTGVADIPDQETGDDSATSAASASQTKTILPTEVGSRLGKYPLCCSVRNSFATGVFEDAIPYMNVTEL